MLNYIMIAAAKDVNGNPLVLDRRIISLFSILLVVLIITITIIVWQDRHCKKNARFGIGNKDNNPKVLDKFISFSYLTLKSFPITRSYIEKLGYRYRLISPCDYKTISSKTVLACFISWGLSILTFICIFLSKPSLITLITAGVAIVLINSEVVGRMAKIFEINILMEINDMISNMIHYFYVKYRVDDALYRSLDNLGTNMRAAGEQIYQLLLSENKNEELREYYENIPNKYLRVFVGQCVSVMERGDQIIDGKMLFVSNLENLQKEVEIEIDKLQRLRLEFLGIILCVLAPIFCINFVKQFAVSIKENMATFFYGKEGFLCDVTLLLIISGIYFILRKSAEYRPLYQSKYHALFMIDRIPIIRKALDNYCDKNATKMERLKRILRNNGSNIRPRHFVMRSCILCVTVFLIGIGIAGYLHKVSREQLLVAEISEVEVLTSAAKENQYHKMSEVIEKYTKRFATHIRYKSDINIPDTIEEMTNILKEDQTFNNTAINEALAEDILRRVDEYKREHFALIDLALCLLLSIVAYYLPEWVIKYSLTVSRDAMEDEVNQFNAIIYMIMYIDGMTVKQILEQMESFSVIFKQSLRNCINDYGSGDLEALASLKEREPYEPFKRIVDNLVRCDDMPIHQAFHEINIDRDGYMAKRKLANEKSIKSRSLRAYILAAVPFIVLFAYGVVPTLLASINEINSMLAELENTSW